MTSKQILFVFAEARWNEDWQHASSLMHFNIRINTNGFSIKYSFNTTLQIHTSKFMKYLLKTLFAYE